MKRRFKARPLTPEQKWYYAAKSYELKELDMIMQPVYFLDLIEPKDPEVVPYTCNDNLGDHVTYYVRSASKKHCILDYRHKIEHPVNEGSEPRFCHNGIETLDHLVIRFEVDLVERTCTPIRCIPRYFEGDMLRVSDYVGYIKKYLIDHNLLCTDKHQYSQEIGGDYSD